MTEAVPIFGAIESPTASAEVTGLIEVQGWTISRNGTEATIRALVNGEPVGGPVTRFSRSDVLSEHTESADTNPTPGFVLYINTVLLANGHHELVCVAEGDGTEVILGKLGFEVANSSQLDFFKRVTLDPTPEQRKRKLERVLSMFRCPTCTGVLRPKAETLECDECRVAFPIRGHAVDFCRESRAVPFDAITTETDYDPRVYEVMEEAVASGGMVLEVGSGRRGYWSEHLVTTEIFAYPFIDVVNDVEELPFVDEVFDFVCSCAVIEHVPKPWVFASEMQRVTKRGGALLSSGAFLQPFHAYPNHFFNMTESAMRLIHDEIEVISLKPDTSQHPWFALWSFLNLLAADLNDEDRGWLTQLSVAQLFEELHNYVESRPSRLRSINLSDNAIRNLAAGFVIFGRRRSESDDSVE